ncbi:zinc transporter ZupT [candidate division WOR-3 bacterium]|nr:zinc transporter ZupT [candidate division WOR-3 bacterium]
MPQNFVYALVLSALAATATTLGSLLGMAVRRPGKRFMAFSLGFSAGVMMFVSFAELLLSSISEIGFARAAIGFFGGMGVMFVVDLLVPHEFVGEHGGPAAKVCDFDSNALLRTGLLIALGIGIHNLPEGMATFAGALRSRGLGIAIASAIALHNIPEGIAVAVPVFCATGSRRKALLWSAMSGAAELAGALLAAAVLMPLLTDAFLAWVLAAVAGLMVFVSFDELIPGSYSYGHEHMSVGGVVGGMALMALSLLALR